MEREAPVRGSSSLSFLFQDPPALALNGGWGPERAPTPETPYGRLSVTGDVPCTSTYDPRGGTACIAYATALSS